MDEDTRLKARELLLRSRIYRFTGLVFAVVGIVLFVVLYFKYIDGNLMQALKNPLFIIIVLLPFLPAFILSGMAIKAENRFIKIIEGLEKSAKQEEDGKSG